MRKFKRQWVYDLVRALHYGEQISPFCSEAEFLQLEDAWEHEEGNGMEHEGIVGFRMKDDGRYYGVKVTKNYHNAADPMAETLPRGDAQGFLTLQEVEKVERVVRHYEWAYIEEKTEK